MTDNKIDLIELKHNIDMLRIQFKGNEAASQTDLGEWENTYGTGLKQGYKQANKGFEKYINRLEKLLEGVNIYE